MADNVEEKDPPHVELVKRLILGAAVGAVIYSALNWQTVSVYLFGGAAYTCENLVPDVIGISEKNGGIFNIKLVGVMDRQQISKTDTRLECKGQGVFATGIKMPIAYRAYEEGGQWWIFYEATP